MTEEQMKEVCEHVHFLISISKKSESEPNPHYQIDPMESLAFSMLSMFDDMVGTYMHEFFFEVKPNKDQHV